MIRCNVTVVGTVFRDSEKRTDKEGNPFVTFGISVPAMDGEEAKDIDISVAADGDDQALINLGKGSKVKVKGTLTFRKRDDSLYCNLSADEVAASDEEECISGTMQFKGTLGSKDIIEKKGKKGQYRIFDAYSSEKVDESNYAYTWVHFIDFTGEEYPWLAPKGGINAEGELELSLFKGKTNITCRVTSLSKWEKNNNQQNHGE